MGHQGGDSATTSEESVRSLTSYKGRGEWSAFLTSPPSSTFLSPSFTPSFPLSPTSRSSHLSIPLYHSPLLNLLKRMSLGAAGLQHVAISLYFGPFILVYVSFYLMATLRTCEDLIVLPDAPLGVVSRPGKTTLHFYRFPSLTLTFLAFALDSGRGFQAFKYVDPFQTHRRSTERPAADTRKHQRRYKSTYCELLYFLNFRVRY